MKVAVCVKQVPVVSMLKLDSATGRLVREGVPSELNYFDVLAISAMSSLKAAHDAEVVAYTMGPPQARSALVQCLAMGADRAVHLVDPAFAGSDTLATARALSLALGMEPFDLIVCGRNSVDSETAQVGPEIAEMLGLHQITGVRRLEVDDPGRTITVERQTDSGYEVIRAELPALITVTEGVGPEAYPSRDAMAEAESKPIVELGAADLPGDASQLGAEGSPTWVTGISSFESDREGTVVRDKPAGEAVALLVEYLEERGALDERSATRPPGPARGARRSAGPGGAVWVVAETLGVELRPVSLELLGKATELADALGSSAEALLIGPGAESHAATLTAHGADTVHLADEPRLAQYDTALYTNVLARCIRAHGPFAVLIPSTVNGRDLAARVAARLSLGLTGDCVGLEIDGQARLVQLKPAFGGNVVAPILSKTMPQMATVRPGITTPVQPDWTIRPVVERVDCAGLGESTVEVLERVTDSSAEGTELEGAGRIVGVGMGLGGPEGLEVVRELADTIGAALGATREVCDAGWLPRQHQIGLSGKAVAPDLYVAVALRGPFNHAVGVQKAGTVVAVNNSPRAPIFKAADFGIVGDYREVVPALTTALAGRPRASGAMTPGVSLP